MTFAEFNAAVRVHLTAYARVQGIQTWIDQLIKAGATDIQRAIEYYRTGHTSSYLADALVEDGFAHKGDVPKGHITGARVYRYDSDTDTPIESQFNWVEQVGWSQAAMMRAGLVDTTARLAVDPQHRTFLLSPALNDETVLVLEWTGIKTDFEDSDETPFDDDVALAVGDYVLARVVRKVDHDLNEAASYAASYNLMKRKLLSDAYEAGRIDDQPVGSSQFSDDTTANTLTAGIRRGVATVANADDETIVVTFDTPFDAAPTEIYLTPETGMPGWVDPTLITATGFTIILAGPGPANTSFFYRAYA